MSDIHADDVPPTFREVEDWFGLMRRYFFQLRKLCRKYQCPLLIAGDVTNKWKLLPETINFLIEELGSIGTARYAIPGQHDLPWHRYGEIKKSAYWTLCEAGALRNLTPGDPTYTPDKSLVLYGYPWGFDVKPLVNRYDPKVPHVALIHAYAWSNMLNSYKGASGQSNLQTWMERTHNFDMVIFGDNHKGWCTIHNTVYYVNNGTFIRRKSDEVDYEPMVSIIYKTGLVNMHKLDTSEDKFSEVVTEELADVDLTELVATVNSTDVPINFEESLRREAENVEEEVGSIAIQCLAQVGRRT